ncbi:hypothetical protein ACHAXT_009693 [Thalassiosira profunda]
MGILSSKPKEASLLAPAMEGNLPEVKRLVGIAIADGGRDNLASASSVDDVDASGNAAVHGAVFAGHLEVLQFLAETCGADVTVKNGLGCSPIWIAAGYDRTECLQYLMDRLQHSEGGDKQLESALLEGGKNNSGDTPFLAAASKGNLKACECLMEAIQRCGGSNDRCLELKAQMLRKANNAGDTPLKVAVASSQSEKMLAFLLRSDDAISPYHAEERCVNRKNNLGLSPLIIACERNQPSIAKLLLQHGADGTIRDAKGRSCLAVAAFCGCNDAIEYLLSQPATKRMLNETDGNGCTALWLAARTGNLSVVKLLMAAGADASIVNNEGLCPHSVASKFKKEKVMEYFAQRAA